GCRPAGRARRDHRGPERRPARRRARRRGLERRLRARPRHRAARVRDGEPRRPRCCLGTDRGGHVREVRGVRSSRRRGAIVGHAGHPPVHRVRPGVDGRIRTRPAARL
ncbi:MAG: hypothetical protein AVDCRST_MAG50-2408, partial [uncultured Acidimicrobiales bacterium]